MGNELRNDSTVNMMPFMQVLTPKEAEERRKRGAQIKKRLPADWVQRAIKQFDNKKRPTYMSPYMRTVTPEEIENRKKLEEYMKKHNLDLKKLFKK